MTKTRAQTQSSNTFMACKDSIVWNSVLHLTANMPPDAGFQPIAAVAQSAELQLASATNSESSIGTRTTHHSDSEMETVSIATFSSSAQHSSRSRSTEGVGVQNNKLFFSLRLTLLPLLCRGVSSALSYKCLHEY